MHDAPKIVIVNTGNWLDSEAISTAMASGHLLFDDRISALPPLPDISLAKATKNKQQPFVKSAPGTGRNQPCPCGSGKKYKKCCL